MDKRRILEGIKRLATANDGEPPGMTRFERETGIRKREWSPTYWLRWGDALQEAGFSPNKLQTAFGNDFLLEKYIGLIREIGHLPVDGELELKSKRDPSFPNRSTFSRFGGKAGLVVAVQQYCDVHDGYDDVLALCRELSRGSHVNPKGEAQKLTTGFVYLMKSARHFKIDRTKSLGRREWELGIKIPVPPEPCTVSRPMIPSVWRRIGTSVSVTSVARENGLSFPLTMSRHSNGGRG